MRELNVDTAYIMNIPKFLNYSMFTYNEQAGALDLSIPLMVNNPYFNIEKQLRAYSEELRQTNNSGILPRENPQRTEGLNILKLIHGYGESELEIGSGLRSGEPVLRIPLTERYLLPESNTDYLGREYLYFDIIHFQALFGYNRLFEAFAHTEVLSDLDSLRTTFKNKDAKKISIWLWKGDYNMVFNEGWHIGAEIGAYRGIFSDNSIIESASFRLSNREGELLHRYCANQFWINGFVKGQNYTAANLTMAASITFYDLYNAEKYEEALKMKIDQDINFYYSSNGGEHGNEGKRPPEDVELSGIQRNGKTVKVTFR
jgi:hypothetical protein